MDKKESTDSDLDSNSNNSLKSSKLNSKISANNVNTFYKENSSLTIRLNDFGNIDNLIKTETKIKFLKS